MFVKCFVNIIAKFLGRKLFFLMCLLFCRNFHFFSLSRTLSLLLTLLLNKLPIFYILFALLITKIPTFRFCLIFIKKKCPQGEIFLKPRLSHICGDVQQCASFLGKQSWAHHSIFRLETSAATTFAFSSVFSFSVFTTLQCGRVHNVDQGWDESCGFFVCGE